MGLPCQSSLIVNPTADLSVVGPLVFAMGPRADANRFSGSGVGTASRFFRVVFHRRGSFDSLVPVMPAFFNFPPLLAPRANSLDLNEVVFKSAGRGALFNLCEVEQGASRRISGRNVIVEPVGSDTYQAIVADCGGTGCSGGDCGGVVEAIENSSVSMLGILDHPGSAGWNRYFVQPYTRALGSCGSFGTFRGDLCATLGAAGLPVSQWSWFESRGAPPPQGGDQYVVRLNSEVFPEIVENDSCLPRDVLGAQLCALRLTERIATPEAERLGLLATGLLMLRVFDRRRRRKGVWA